MSYELRILNTEHIASEALIAITFLANDSSPA
jgi:hypothetical protein